MKHSVIFVSGANLVYQTNPELPPTLAGAEGSKEKVLWQQKSVNHLIKPEDHADFEPFLQESTGVAEHGTPVPVAFVETYSDPAQPGRKFARKNKGVILDMKTQQPTALVVPCPVCHSGVEYQLDGKQPAPFPICEDCLSALRFLRNQVVFNTLMDAEKKVRVIEEKASLANLHTALKGESADKATGVHGAEGVQGPACLAGPSKEEITGTGSANERNGELPPPPVTGTENLSDAEMQRIATQNHNAKIAE